MYLVDCKVRSRSHSRRHSLGVAKHLSTLHHCPRGSTCVGIAGVVLNQAQEGRRVGGLNRDNAVGVGADEARHGGNQTDFFLGEPRSKTGDGIIALLET
ncbi:hypothetical protein M5K25_026704 [Dendrobium thyrsiflorum]|uniref:Uncharacterized protein n=1 Tax=Dendrobium thyrsiflorum TaxID=117978 RepID=A0ABD0TY75_DENTH